MKNLNHILSSFICLVLVALPMSAQMNVAQKALSQLTFEAPKALYRVKGNYANVRISPNAKAAKYNFDNEYIYAQGQICAAQIVNDMGDNPNWVTTTIQGKRCYISKSVMVKAEEGNILPSVFNNYYGWIDPNDDGYDSMSYINWRIGKIKGNSGLYLCYLNREYLLLGKLIDNVLVFKYKIRFESNYSRDEAMPAGKILLDSEKDEYGEKVYYLKPNNSMFKTINLRGYNVDVLDLTKVDESMVYALFKEEIESNRTNYFYLTSYWFNQKWRDNLPG